MTKIQRKLERWLGRRLATLLPEHVTRALVVELCEHERERQQPRTVRPVETQIADLCQRLGFAVELIVGDSRTVDVDTGEVDLVLIDGDHSSEMARNDFERFGRRVRVAGAVLFDDAFDDGFHHVIHTDGVGPVVREIIAGGDYRLVRTVKRLAHLERVR